MVLRKDGPPIVPAARESLDRAIILLGNRCQSDLKSAAREELKTLIGTYPNPAQAAIWKQMLSRLRKPEPLALG